MSENEQNGTHEAPDSLRMVVKFPIAQYGQLEVNAWMKQGESLQAQIDAFMDEVIYHVTPRAAELAQAWTQATIASVQGEPPASGVPLPAGPAPVGDKPQPSPALQEVRYAPKAADRVPGQTWVIRCDAYTLTAKVLELWRAEGAQYPDYLVYPGSSHWPAEDSGLTQDGGKYLWPDNRIAVVRLVVSSKKITKGAHVGNYFVDVMSWEWEAAA